MLLVRPAESGEAHRAAELYIQARRAAAPAIPAPVHSDDEVRSWFVTKVFVDQQLWVAEEGGEIVGLMVLAGEWLDQLYVDPARTASGVGSALITEAKRLRPGGLQLWTFVSNEGARRFYERHGFGEVERTDGAHNEEKAPDIRYAWDPRSPA